MKNMKFKITEKILELLKSNKYNSCSVESCSGGGIAKALTDVPGASEAFVGGVIAYSNEIKERLLDVNTNILKEFGAVSEEVVIEMADNTVNIFETDFCIASTGIAGPTGGTMKKPVGTVWLAVATPSNVMTLECHFNGDRESIREQTIMEGLKFLNEEIENYINNN